MKKENYFKLFLELVVIFLSVVLAFFFDDFRESRNEKTQYEADLLTFRNELAGVIGDMSVKLDSFQTKGDLMYRGAKVKRMVNLNWFDYLVRKRKASMSDFRYLVKSNYLWPEFGGYNQIPQANEIRLKYTEHIHSKDLLRYLTIYDEEMKNMSIVNQELSESVRELEGLIHKMDPYLNFDKQDSILLYSKEFIWAYANCVEGHKSEFQFSKWLVQDRLIKVISSVNRELELLDVNFQNDSKCYSSDFYQRFECDHKRQIEPSDSLIRIVTMTVMNRIKYLKAD